MWNQDLQVLEIDYDNEEAEINAFISELRSNTTEQPIEDYDYTGGSW